MYNALKRNKVTPLEVLLVICAQGQKLMVLLFVTLWSELSQRFFFFFAFKLQGLALLGSMASTTFKFTKRQARISEQNPIILDFVCYHRFVLREGGKYLARNICTRRGACRVNK